METHRHIIFYDIRDASRLRKTARILEDYGTRVQKSFFEADLDDRDLDELWRRLGKVIDPSADGVKLFRLCRDCRGRRLAVGQCVEAGPQAPWEIL